MVKWLVVSNVFLLVLLGGIVYFGNKQVDAIPAKSDLMGMDGYIFYLTPENRWVITTVSPSENITSEMTYEEVKYIVGMQNIHLLDVPDYSTFSMKSFKHGDAVTIWAQGIMESYPSHVMPRIMEYQ